MSRGGVVSAVAALAAALLILGGCGGSDDPAVPARERADTSVAAGMEDRRLLTRVNTACLQARAGSKPGRPARGARGLRRYARRKLPVSVRMLAALREVEVPPANRAALRALRAELERLLVVYTDLAEPVADPREGMAETLRVAEASVRSRALAARLPACVP